MFTTYREPSNGGPKIVSSVKWTTGTIESWKRTDHEINFLQAAYKFVADPNDRSSSPPPPKITTSKRLTSAMYKERVESLLVVDQFERDEKYWEENKPKDIPKPVWRPISHRDYHWRSKYYVDEIGSRTYIRLKKNNKILLPQSQVFATIKKWHEANCHAKVDTTYNDVCKEVHNITHKECKAYIDVCQHCNKALPKRVKHKGARKYIETFKFRDRMQADLIDYSKDERQDMNGVVLRYLLVVKDHFTRFTYLKPVPCKKPEHVADALNHYFSIVGTYSTSILTFSRLPTRISRGQRSGNHRKHSFGYHS